MHPKQRQRLSQNLNFLATHSPASSQAYLSAPKSDLVLVYDDAHPLEPTNFIYRNNLFYPTDVRTYAQYHIADHIKNLTPFKMPVLIFSEDDPIVFRHIISMEKELGTTVFGSPNLTYWLDKLYCPTIFVFGAGLGCLVDELLRLFNPCNMILLESDADLFTAFLMSADLREINAKLARKGGHLFCQFNPDITACLQGAFDNALKLPSGQLNCFHAFVAHDQNIMPSITKNFATFAPRMLSGLTGYFNDERRQIVQTFENLLAVDKILHGSSAPFDDATAVVVGSGPSLDKTIADLARIKGRVVIFACGTAMTPLLKQGIVPDFYVELETHPVTLDFVKLVSEYDVYHKTVFIGSTGVPAAAFTPWLNKFIFVRDRSTSSYLLAPLKHVKASWPMVGNAGVAIATSLGFRRILLMGLDCGMRHGGQHHSTESTYYDGTMEKIQGDAPALNMNYVADHLKQDILDPEKQSIFEIPSVKGDKVFAQHLMWYSHIYLENLFRETPGMQAVQISEGAYINYATNVLPEDFDTEIIPSKSDDIMDRLLQRLVSLDGYIESYIKAARKIGADGDRLRRLISSHFERPIKSLDDWLKRLGTANNDIAPFRANDSLAWGLINGSYDKTTKSITERALMIEDQIFRLRFLQLGATKVQNIVSDMAASLKQLAPDLESIRTAQQNPIKISQQKSAVRHAD